MSKKTFDDFAASFDTVLADLDYQVPKLLGDVVQSIAGEEESKEWDIIDLGCGTGLCCQFLRPFAKRLVGVDLSSKMLDKAEERGGYDDLVHADLTEYLSDCATTFDLVFSADTLMYLGDLGRVFDGVASVLNPGGAFIFSLEKLGGDDIKDHEGYRLDRTGRFQHTRESILDWLRSSGLAVESIREERLRDEGRLTVKGYLVHARRA